MPHWATGAISTLLALGVAAGFGLYSEVGVLRSELASARKQIDRLESDGADQRNKLTEARERHDALKEEVRRAPKCPK